ncbi:MAG: carboxynorspermidine decarboxylase [Bacteroidota bacterium]
MAKNYELATSPAFILEEQLLRQNLELLRQVQTEANISIILALKAFAMWRVFPTVAEYLSGATASSLNEARLIYEEMGQKAHTYAVAYSPTDFQQIMDYSSHITFNSLQQYQQHQQQIDKHAAPISCGIRINPEYATVETSLYNPAAKGSRLGVTSEILRHDLPDGIEGLHFHTLCESNASDLERTLAVVESKFGQHLPQLKWLNMGGGHLITGKNYEVSHLIRLLKNFKNRYPNLDIILEPGSAIAWQTGVLLASVLDIVTNSDVRTAILDVSFTAHMPDTLEMPYRPAIRGASDTKQGRHLYRLGGVSCLAGDYLDAYAFDTPLKIGDRIIFEDMIHYTMVKTSFFNGVQHPAIYYLRTNGTMELVRQFDYKDFRKRLG